MKKIFFLAFLSLSVLAKSQTTVKGIFTEQNSGNKPVVGVQIKALGANPEVSDNSGLFQLVFGAKKPGDRVIVSEIKKKGYEIVNKKEVDSWLIGSNPNQRTKVVMCPEGLIAENTAKYYDISLKAVTDGYNKRISELQKQLAKAQIDAKTYGAQAKTLSDQFTNQQNQLEELADKFARENFDDCSAIQKQAFEAFKQGNIEEAIRILETVDSDAEIAKAKVQKSKGESLVNEGKSMQNQADSVIQQNIAKLMFQGDMYATNYRFEDAEKAYEKAVMADTTNIKNIGTYAEFLSTQGEFEKSISWYSSLLKRDIDLYNKSQALSQISNLQSKMNQFDIAEANFKKTLSIKEELVKVSNEYDYDLAIVYHNFANLYRKMNNYEKTEDNYRKAIEILSSQTKDNSKYWLELAIFLNDLGSLQQDINLYDKAETNILKSLDIMKNNNGSNSTQYQKEKASILNNLGFIQRRTNQFEKSEKNYDEALNLYRLIANQNPQAYNCELAFVLNNIACLQQDISQYDKAEDSFKESIKLYRELAKENPSVFNPELSTSLNNLSVLQKAMNRFDDSEANLNEALDIAKKLSNDNPEVYNSTLALRYSNLASLQNGMSKYEQAEKNNLEALKIRKILAESNPQLYNPDLAISLNNIASMYDDMKQFENAQMNYMKSLKVYKDLAKDNQAVYSSDVAMVYGNLSILYNEMNNLDSAIFYCKEALTIYRDLYNNDERVYSSQYSGIMYFLAKMQVKSKDFDNAERNFDEALQIRKKLVVESPEVYSKVYAKSLFVVAQFVYNRNLLKAINYIDEAITTYKILKEANANVSLEYDQCCSQMSYFKLLNKQYSEAEKYARMAIAENSNSNVKNLAHSLLYQGKYEEAVKFYTDLKVDDEIKKQILVDFDEFEKLGITHPDITKIRELYSK